MTFALADDTRYTPDVMVVNNDGTINFTEIGGTYKTTTTSLTATFDKMGEPQLPQKWR